MGKITDITMQRSGKRANIFIDGSFVCGLELITVMSEGLKAGDEIDREKLEAIQVKSETEKAFNKAVSYLSVRRRTEWEIRKKLREKGYLPAVADEVLRKLRDYGYVDDGRFAETYIEMYKHRAGELKIRADLRRLGVDGKIIDDKLSAVNADETIEAAESAARKYLRSHDYDRLKLSRHLAAKGYRFDVIDKVARAAAQWEEDND